MGAWGFPKRESTARTGISAGNFLLVRKPLDLCLWRPEAPSQGYDPLLGLSQPDLRDGNKQQSLGPATLHILRSVRPTMPGSLASPSALPFVPPLPALRVYPGPCAVTYELPSNYVDKGPPEIAKYCIT